MVTVQDNLDQRLAEEFVNYYNLENFDLDNLTEETANKIVGEIKNAYNGLNNNSKAKTAPIIGMTFEHLVDVAQDYLDEIAADKFITNNSLDKDLTKSVAKVIIDSEDDFDKLSDTVKEKVLTKLGVDSYDEIIDFVKFYLDCIAAEEFYDNYLDGLDEEKIVSGVDAWNSSSKNVQDLINDLLNYNDVEETYPELLEKAKDALNEKAAQDFINEYLTKDNEVIKESTRSNAKQIINAEEAYNLLSDEVKEIVNAKLKEVSNTTYPELLKAAQDLQKNPKTGDISRIMMILLGVSVLGIVVTRRKRK